jgi:hypothetical protein
MQSINKVLYKFRKCLFIEFLYKCDYSRHTHQHCRFVIRWFEKRNIRKICVEGEDENIKKECVPSFFRSSIETVVSIETAL